MANIGYIRVSTIDQNTARQEEALKPFNCEKVFIEKISGKNADRPELTAMMEYIREGDTLIVSEISRLARNTKDLLKIVEDLNNKGVLIKILKEGIDTTTATGKFMLTIFGAIAELERHSILERQAEGIAVAKAKGIYTGRKVAPLPSNWNDIKERYLKGELKAVEAMKLSGVTKTRFYKLIKK